MECYYDTLFEVDCRGIDKLKDLPCGYQLTGFTFSMNKPWEMSRGFTYVDMNLFKKLEWISKCGSFQGGHVTGLVSLKSPIVRYFFKALYKYEWYERSPGFWDWKVMPTVPSCYYLGTYPIYWNVDNKTICFPNNLMTPNAYPLGSKAGIPKKIAGMGLIQYFKELFEKGETPMEFIPDSDRRDLRDALHEFGLTNLLNFLKPERVTQKMTLEQEAELRALNSKIDQAISHITLRYDKDRLFDYFIQDDWFERREKAFKECLNRYYPKKPREPEIKVTTPREPALFPGKPMNEILKPSPEMTPMPSPPAGKRILKLTIYFGIKEDTPENALDLQIHLLERF